VRLMTRARAVAASLFENGLRRLRPRKNRISRSLENVAAEGELEVQILERRPFSMPTVGGEPRVEVWITYRFGSLPPGLVRIPQTELTPEKERAVIRADIQARLGQKPETMKV